MKSIKSLIQESILSSTNAGRESIIKRWIDVNELKEKSFEVSGKLGISSALLNLDDLKNEDGKIIKKIPDYIEVFQANTVFTSSEQALSNLPKVMGTLIIKGIKIKDFGFLSRHKIGSLYVSQCDISSLKGLDDIEDLGFLRIGDNKQHFSIKEIKKYSYLKEKDIYNFGYVNEEGLHGINMKGIKQTGQTDYIFIKKEAEKIINIYKKEFSDLKKSNYVFECGSSHIFFRLDFSDPYISGFDESCAYLGFLYDFASRQISLYNSGIIPITKKDKEKYPDNQRFKSFTDPYIKNGGKIFKNAAIPDFTAENITIKTIPWIKKVIEASEKGDQE